MNSFVLKHVVREPSARARDRAPALILLHGLRSNEQDLIGLAPLLDERLFVVSVRAPLVMGHAAYAWYDVEFVPGGYVIDGERAARSRDTVLEFAGQVCDSYNVDPGRVFLMGFSQGAAISVAAALHRPRLFAGVVAMSGRYIEELRASIADADELSGLPALVVHGTGDTVIPIEHGRALKRELSRLPLALTYREYEMAHQVTEDSLHDIASWITQQLNAGRDWRTAGA